MITAHPSNQYLMAYANGSLSDGMNLLVAAHLTYCPECREKVERYELLQGSLMESALDEEEAHVTTDLGALLSRLEVPEVESTPNARRAHVPSPLAAHLPDELDALNWRFRMPGLYDYPLPQFEGEDVCLLKAKPGVGMWAHTHEQDEATLVLTGAMEDGETVLRSGDVAIAGPDHDHHPKIVGDEVCYCLVVMSGRLKFTGPVSRALNFFT